MAAKAAPTSTDAFLPAATSSSCRCILLPNKIGAVTVPAAAAPTPRAVKPVTPKAAGKAAAAPIPRPSCGSCSPTTSPAYRNAEPTPSTSVDCIAFGCSRDNAPRRCCALSSTPSP